MGKVLPLKPNSIERSITEIAAGKDFARRIPANEGDEFVGIARSINMLLSHVEQSEQDLRRRLAELADARDDAQTSNLLLRRTKHELHLRSEQLDAALQKSSAASSAKSQFLANMSHEIRTPMNGILGMAELVSRSQLEPKQRQQIRTIVDSGRALLTIINDILDFSKIESGKFELDPRPFDLHLCLSDIVELLVPAARQKALDLRLDIDPDLSNSYIGDAGRIRQVVTNLAGNAVKFTDRGSVTLRLSGSRQGNQANLRIEVIDTGIGIPAEKLDDVFETFSQVDQTCTRRHDGTGLGLSICKLLAARMGGGISAKSELGKGSTFCFSLTLGLPEPKRQEPAPVLDLNGRHIVLVGSDDDVEPALSVLAAAQCGVTKSAFFSELAGLLSEKASSKHFDAMVVMRCSVSEELLNEIKAFRGAIGDRDLPILVVVTVGSQGDAKALSEAGAQGYISGAYDAKVFVRAIQHIQLGNMGTLVTKHSLAETLVRQEQTDASRARSEASRSRVLIVDDSLVNQEVAREFLDDVGCEIEVAGNGKIAVDLTAATTFDLILMDCQMPVMDGFAATAAIRSRRDGATRSDVPIIALTANAFASDREKCLEHGMTDFLSKPFLPDEFDGLVRKWLASPACGRSQELIQPVCTPG